MTTIDLNGKVALVTGSARRLAFLASPLAMSTTHDRSQTHTVGDLTDVTTAD